MFKHLLHKYKKSKKMDKHMDHDIYIKVNGNVFKNKCVMMKVYKEAN